MSPERRQKVLVALIPALLVGIGFVYLYELPLEKRVKAVNLQVADAVAATPDPLNVDGRAEKLRSLEMQVARLKKIQERDSANPVAGGTTLSVSEAGEKLARLLASHGLLLVEESTGGTAAIAALPKGLEEMAKAAPGRLRTLKMRGRYADVVAALGGIREAVGNAIALELKMSAPKEDEEAREWTLVLWI